jgi:glycosyltransferase involved in cell wall biosynthesis
MNQLSVVIPTHSNIQGLKALLSSLKKCENINQTQVIVVVNPMTNEYRKLAEQFPEIVWTSIQAANVSQARNHGAKIAQGDVLLYLDDDCLVTNKELLRLHLELHQLYPDAIAMAGGYELESTESIVTTVYHLIQMKWFYSGLRQDGIIVNGLGGHISYKKKAFLLAQFHSEISFGGSENYFHQQLYRCGERMRCAPDLFVQHHSEISFFSFLRKAFLQGMGTQYLSVSKEPVHQDFQFFQEQQIDQTLNSAWYYRGLELVYFHFFELGKKTSLELRKRADCFWFMTGQAILILPKIVWQFLKLYLQKSRVWLSYFFSNRPSKK